MLSSAYGQEKPSMGALVPSDIEDGRVHDAAMLHTMRTRNFMDITRNMWKALAVVSVVVFALIVLGVYAAIRAEKLRITEHREMVAGAISPVAEHLLHALHDIIGATYILSVSLANSTSIDLEVFDRVAELFTAYDAVSTLQLAPGGVVSAVSPREGSEGLIGLDILGLEAQRAVACRLSSRSV